METGRIAVRIVATGRGWDRAIRRAKQVGGRYDPARRLWRIPADRPELGAPGAYGWRIEGGPGVEQVGRCPHWTREQGCPLHGETCNPAYAG